MTSPAFALFAACDRFNYGDLLFGMLLKQRLDPLLAPSLRPAQIVGMVASDMSRYGAPPTLPLSWLFDPRQVPDGSVVMVAGGQVLPARWAHLLNYLDHPLRHVLPLTQRMMSPGRVEAVVRWLMGGRSFMPFLLSTSDFSARVRIVYNTIGCRGVSRLPKEDRSVCARVFGQATYFSVRENESRDAVVKITDGAVVPQVAPDSAILMARQFDLDQLTGTLRPNVRQWLDEHAGRYLCFQISENWLRTTQVDLAGQLDRVRRDLGLPVLLLPVGRARGHGDTQALRQIGQRMSPPLTPMDDLTVQEIMALIAHAGAMVGTSLHAAVTASAFAVPHIGLFAKHTKLVAYLRQWEPPAQARCIEPDQIVDQLPSILDQPRDLLRSHRDQLLALYDADFARMTQALGLSENRTSGQPAHHLQHAILPLA